MCHPAHWHGRVIPRCKHAGAACIERESGLSSNDLSNARQLLLQPQQSNNAKSCLLNVEPMNLAVLLAIQCITFLIELVYLPFLLFSTSAFL